MGIEHKEHDDAIDKVLAALRNAPPPEGLEARIDARIAQRLERQSTQPAKFRWRDVLAGSALGGAWWRGAISGAAAAAFAVCVVLLVQHRSRTTPAHVQTAVGSNAAKSGGTSPYAMPASQSRATPCAHSTVLRVATEFPAQTHNDLRAETYAESTAPSRPAPELPLTPQERELARLARTADPRDLATLSPEYEAKLEAEKSAEFAKFFTPPPPQPAAPEVNPAANPESDQKASPEASPAVKESSPAPTDKESPPSPTDKESPSSPTKEEEQ